MYPKGFQLSFQLSYIWDWKFQYLLINRFPFFPSCTVCGNDCDNGSVSIYQLNPRKTYFPYLKINVAHRFIILNR